MIDQQLIESARNIRKKFLNLNKELSGYQDDVKGLVDFLNEKIKYLQDYNNTKVKKMNSKEQISVVTKDILVQIEEIESAEKKIQKKMSKISDELEKLNKEEVHLYQTIKERYPNLTDSEIIYQIQRNL